MFEEDKRKQSNNPIVPEVDESTVFARETLLNMKSYMGVPKGINVRELDAYLMKYDPEIQELYEKRHHVQQNLDQAHKQEQIDQQEKRTAAIAIENQREREIEIKQLQLELQLIEMTLTFRRVAAAAMARYHEKQENDELQDELDDKKLLAIEERYEALAESSSKFYESLSEKDNLTEDFLEEFYSEIEPLENEYNDLQYDNALDNIEKKGFEVERDADGVKGKTRMTGKDQDGNVRTQMTYDRNNHEFMIERLDGDEETMRNAADNIIELESSKLSGPEHNLECTLKCTPEAQNGFSTFLQVLEKKISPLELSHPQLYGRLNTAIASAKLGLVNEDTFTKGMSKVMEGLEEMESSVATEESPDVDNLAQKQQQELDSTPTPDPQTTKSKVREEDSDLSSGKEDEALPLHKQAQEVMQQKMQEQEMGQQQQKSTWPPNPMMQSDQQYNIEVERQRQLDQGTAAPAA
ncbi:hypothetical protein L3V83_06210 [Thiotrichales bacterium 19X7-9]|nr:hypothetical protein [Thiotrichales bacterium 19X7-9]